jgi:hypothetical protein
MIGVNFGACDSWKHIFLQVCAWQIHGDHLRAEFLESAKGHLNGRMDFRIHPLKEMRARDSDPESLDSFVRNRHVEHQRRVRHRPRHWPAMIE